MKKIISSCSVKYSESIQNAFKSLLADTAIGFTRIPERLELFSESEKLAAEMSQKFEQFLVVGIGGSSMGARALVEISGRENIHFLDNVDAAEFSRIWSKIQPKLNRTGILVVSKSGSTVEILWNYTQLEDLAKKQNVELIQQSYFVTELRDNPLYNLAVQASRPVLSVPLDVGGRFSVLTPVGLVVAALCGFNLNDLRTGAADILKNPEESLAACENFLASFNRNEDQTLFWFYNSNYRWFGAWLQQLWAESLGKKTDLSGKPAPAFSTPLSAIGACDQHSILQQVAHGTKKNKFVCFYSFSSCENSEFSLPSSRFQDLEFAKAKNYGELIRHQARATEEALKLNQVNTAFFEINDENKSYSLGYLLMYFQIIVAILGVHEKINPFDQPGVALGKELTLKSLKEK